MSAQLALDRLREAIALKQRVAADSRLATTLAAAAEACIKALRNDGTVLWCGNGGSAADAQHLAAELTGRFYYDRPPLRSDALHLNGSALTALANDYDYDLVYARLARAQLRPGDVLIGLSTSGNSDNVVRALAVARQLGAATAGFTGQGGGRMAELSDFLLDVPSTDTPRIQEVHMNLGHSLCEIVEATLFPRDEQ